MAMLELISFDVGAERYCLDVQTVREIRIWTPATPIPHAPPYMRGMINLRGAIMPIVDLRARLGQGRTEVTARHVIIVVQAGASTAGLLVDAVEETFVVDEAEMQPPPKMSGNEASLVEAILPREGLLLSRLNLASLLPDEVQAA
jgi:purine-binding chemotaxis protein CheW